MTTTGWDIPLVEKVELPGSSAGFAWKPIALLEPKKLSIPEKVKATKSPLALLDELDMLAEEAREAERLQKELGIPGSICTAHETRLKWLGLFHRGKIAPGTYMWRFRIPNGVVTAPQLRALAGVLRPYDAGGDRGMWARTACADITSRASLQLRGVRLETLPADWRRLAAAGLSSLQTGMDSVRTAVGSPLAGLDPAGLVDTRPFCAAAAARLHGGGRGAPDLANLPRKRNVCYVGSPDLLEHPHVNDLAFLPAAGPAGEPGWLIEVGHPPPGPSAVRSMRCFVSVSSTSPPASCLIEVGGPARSVEWIP